MGSVGTTPVVVSCEHASNALPAKYRNLGLREGLLRTHLAWDPGARFVARRLAGGLGCRCFEGRNSRLLIDLNRGRNHPRAIPSHAAAVEIPPNQRISRDDREARLLDYWVPHRTAVAAAVRDSVREQGRCLHLAIHSFAPVVDGQVRNCDVGLLFDPRRRPERDLAELVRLPFVQAGLKCRFNYPYRGAGDGLTTFLRQSLLETRYIGLEVEINQSFLVEPGGRGQSIHSLMRGIAAFLSPE